MESNLRVGIGYDTHPLAKKRRLVLGGVEIPFNKGLSGWSDADVLTHAIIDALLGAAALGDIGSHFPPGEAEYEDIYERKIAAIQEFHIDEQNKKAFLGELYFAVNGKRLGEEVIRNDS